MRFGVTTFLTDRTMTPGELARACEERGFDSFWVPEHTHIPTSRRTPAPMGDPLPEEYRRTLDPYVALAFAAAATERITVGTGVSLVAQRDAIVTAKTIATLDHLSNGRVVVGAGFGWNVEEMRSHGVEPRTRRALTRETILAMRALWTDEVASFEGEYVAFEPSWAWPKPVQRRLPVLLGGAGGPTLFAHIAEYADGWIPIGGSGVARALPRLREAVEAAGRDPAALRIVPFGSLPDPGKIEYFASIGVTETVFRVPADTTDAVLTLLDRCAATIEPYRKKETP